MGYKLLGFAVWQGGKWYLGRRYSRLPRKAAVGAVAGLALAAGVAVALRQRDDE
jgi:hypothetical protein